MGLFDKIKRAFNPTGLDIDLDAPDTFRFTDSAVPVTVTISAKDAERVVTGLTFVLRDYEDIDERREREERERNARTALKIPRGEALRFEHAGPIVVAPDRPATLVVDVPLGIEGVLDQARQAGAEGEVPGWVSKAAGAASFLQERTRDDDAMFEILVVAAVEGFDAAPSETRKIKNLRRGERGGKHWSIGI